MPILRGSPRIDSTKAKEQSKVQDSKRETRSSKSPAVCASLRLKEFKSSHKLTKAEVKTAAAARLSQRNKRKAEKEPETSKESENIELKTPEVKPRSPKKGSPSKKPLVGLGSESKKAAEALQDTDPSEKDTSEKGKEKLQKSSEPTSFSDESQNEEKEDGRHKRKQSLEVKDDTNVKKRRKLAFFEYVVEEISPKKERNEKHVEQVEDDLDEDSGGRRRSKRGSIPNTLYLKNFIDPSKRTPKGSKSKLSKKGLEKSNEVEAKPSYNQDRVEIIKWEVDGPALTLTPKGKTSAVSQKSTSKGGEGIEEGGVSEAPPTAQGTLHPDAPPSGEKSINEAPKSSLHSKAMEETSSERDTDSEIKELLTQMSKQKDNSIDLEITKMSVVYINNESNEDGLDEEKMENEKSNQKTTKADNDSADVVMECPTETCIEIHGVTEEVDEIAGETGETVEIDSVNQCVQLRERPGRICKQEVEEMEEDENFIAGVEEKSKKSGVEDKVKKTVGGTELQEVVSIQVISPKERKVPVQTTDMSVQADDFSDSDNQGETSVDENEINSAEKLTESEKSSADNQKNPTIITMPDGRSLTVTSTDKAAFTFRTVSKPTISKQAHVRRITLPSGPTGLKIINANPELLNKVKSTLLSPEGDVITEGPEGIVLEAVQKSQDNWNAVYKSQGVGNDNQEVILVSLPEGQEVKQKFPFKPKKIDDVAFEINEDGEYVCGVCNYKTSRKSNWYKHRKKHMGQKTHKCEYCNYVAATSSNLKRHQNIHLDVREHHCDQCGQTFRQKIHLERHIKYKHEEKSVKCPLCDYVCANENPDLKVHIKRRHIPQEDDDTKEAKSYSCEECGLMTYSKKDMRQHMKFHKNGPELKLFCEQCSFVTDCESRLKRHVLIHSHERPYQCGLCDYRGSQKEHVLRHMKTQHQVYVEKRSKRGLDVEDSDSKDSSTADKQHDKSDYSSQEKIFACNHCSMKFSKLINLYKHLHGQHKEVLPQDSEEFLCVVCDFRTSSKKNLLVHMRKHNLQDQVPPSHVYSCVLCRYMNPRRRNLFQHMKKKHGIEIVIRDDGSTSCFVTDSVPSNEDSINNILTVGDVVTTSSEEAPQLQIVTDDASNTQNIISIEDLAYAVSHPKPNTRLIKETTVKPRIATVVKEHEAAEAIEGLQALAGQPGITQFTIESQKQDIMETEVITMENPVEFVEEKEVEKDSGYQLTTDQLMGLSTGDFVEINGEMYKVEISTEDAGNLVSADVPKASSVQSEIGLLVTEAPQTVNNQLVLEEVGNDHLGSSIARDSQTSLVQTQTSNNDSAPTMITDNSQSISQVDSVADLKETNQEDLAETKPIEKVEPTENTVEIPEGYAQEATADGESTNNGQDTVTTTIEDVLMQVQTGENMATSNISSEEPNVSEGVITSEILGIQHSEPIPAQTTFSTDDQQLVEKMEAIVTEESSVPQEMMEVGDIAELANSVTANPSDNNNADQITELAYLQQEVDTKITMDTSDSDAMATSS